MKKELSSFTNLSRLAPLNHLRSIAPKMKAVAPGVPITHSPIGVYSPSNLWAWVTKVGKYWFTKKHPFKTYSIASDGVHVIGNQIKISIAGDWGTGTDEAAAVAAQIEVFTPDYSIHLGDVYYVGSQSEVNENFLGIKSSVFEPVTWPLGKLGTFALAGNHDMYSNGSAYFDMLLPKIGQAASFFCLQNDYWRIIGLDTGYNSTGMEIWPFKPNCKLPEELVTWLASLDLKNKNDSRGIILLSHHQPFSAFEREYPTPAKQLATLIDRPVLWFWGHEHRLTIYKNQENVKGLTILGRCIGHGGMPIELKTSKDKRTFLTDNRLYSNGEGLKIGYNGFANFIFNDANLSVEYRDLNGGLVASESRNAYAI